MPMYALLILAALVLVTWLWYNSLRIRETAVLHAQRACRLKGYQLLDETVSLQALRPQRDGHGRLVLQRTYRFDYSESSTDRRQGFILMLGAEIVSLGLAEAGTLH